MWSRQHVLSFPTAQSHLSGGDYVQDGKTLNVYETRFQPTGEHTVSSAFNAVAHV